LSVAITGSFQLVTLSLKIFASVLAERFNVLVPGTL
jgi:hypothetical protein